MVLSTEMKHAKINSVSSREGKNDEKIMEK